MVCRQTMRTFRASATSVAEARLWAQEALEGWGIDQGDPASTLVPDILLVVSELTTNAVKSRSQNVVVQLVAHRDHIEVHVADQDPAPARWRDISDQGGRGLRIVDAVTSEWGQRNHDGSTKTVWGRLAVPAGSALAAGCRL